MKVIDLGSSCFTTDSMSSYVQSRSYRAPEVILGLPYQQTVDIWSLGCILAELLSGYVLFQARSSCRQKNAQRMSLTPSQRLSAQNQPLKLVPAPSLGSPWTQLPCICSAKLETQTFANTGTTLGRLTFPFLPKIPWHGKI